MSYDPSCSLFNSAFRSNFGDLICAPPGTVTVITQTMKELKVWPGGNINYGDRSRAIFHCLNHYDPSNSAYWDASGGGDPPSAYQAAFRKRYLNSTVSYSFDGASYSETSSFSGAGFVPITNNGMPASIGGYPPVFTGVETRPWRFPTEELAYNYPHAETYDWLLATYDHIDSPEPGTDHQIFSYNFSSEVLFATHLGTALSRLAARSWPTFPVTSTSYNERFDEWQLDGSTTDMNPAHYTGNPVSDGTSTPTPIVVIYSPNSQDVLQSTWFWPTRDYWDIPADLADYIVATRTRFMVDKPIKYWIAKARLIKLNYGINNGTLVDVTLIHQGVAQPGVPVEIPVHPDDSNFVVTGSQLSNASLCFAILGELPAAWSARTGITVH